MVLEGETVELELAAESAGTHTVGIRVEPQKTASKIPDAYERIHIRLSAARITLCIRQPVTGTIC